MPELAFQWSKVTFSHCRFSFLSWDYREKLFTLEFSFVNKQHPPDWKKFETAVFPPLRATVTRYYSTEIENAWFFNPPHTCKFSLVLSVCRARRHCPSAVYTVYAFAGTAFAGLTLEGSSVPWQCPQVEECKFCFHPGSRPWREFQYPVIPVMSGSRVFWNRNETKPHLVNKIGKRLLTSPVWASCLKPKLASAVQRRIDYMH